MVRAAAWALLAIGLAGCGEDRRAWREELTTSGAERLAGAWSIHFAIDSIPGKPAVPPVPGTMAFTLNAERLPGAGSGGPPMLFGTYAVDFAAAGLAAGSGAEVPEVVARVRSDSVILVLGPGSLLPMELRGVIRADTVLGRWRVSSRSRPTSEGSFAMTRP